MFQFTPRNTTAQAADEAEKPLSNDDVIDRALKTLKSNARLNFAARLLLMLFALAASVLAVIYVYVSADKTVEDLAKPGGDMIGERLLALTAPVLLLAMFAALAALAVAVHPFARDRRVGSHARRGQPPAARGRGRRLGARPDRRLRGPARDRAPRAHAPAVARAHAVHRHPGPVHRRGAQRGVERRRLADGRHGRHVARRRGVRGRHETCRRASPTTSRTSSSSSSS